jgi:hypothetical protein
MVTVLDVKYVAGQRWPENERVGVPDEFSAYSLLVAGLRLSFSLSLGGCTASIT